MFEIGETAPDFELLNSEEKPVSLSDYLGRRVVLFFYPKAGTSGCTNQACGFRDNFPSFEAANATVVGISPDEPAALAKWISAENLPFTLLSDPDHKVADQYGVWGEKSMYGRKYLGIIRSHFVIDEQGIFEDIQFKVSPKNSIARALKTVG